MSDSDLGCLSLIGLVMTVIGAALLFGFGWALFFSGIVILIICGRFIYQKENS